MSLFEKARHFYNIPMDSEYLPNMFRAAALLLFMWIDSYIAWGESSSCYNILLQRSKHCLGFSISKYR